MTVINRILCEAKKAYRIISRDGTWIFFGRLYLTVSSLLLSVVLARLLMPAEYGIYKYAFEVIALVTLFALPETSQILFRYREVYGDQIYNNLLNLRRGSTLVGAACLVVYAAWELYVNGDYRLFLLLAATALLLPIYLPHQLYEAYLQSYSRFRQLNVIYIVRASAHLVAVPVVYLMTSDIYIATFATLVALTVVTWRASLRVTLRLSAAPPVSRVSFTRQSVLLTFASTGLLLLDHLDKVLVGKILGYEQLALFIIGVTTGSTLNGFFKPFLTAFSARLVHKRLDVAHYTISLLLGTMVGFCLAPMASIAIPAIYGEQYADSAKYAEVLLQSMGIYLMCTLHYRSRVLHKASALGKVYIAGAIVPLVILPCIWLILQSSVAVSDKLFLLSLSYPLRHLLMSLVLFIGDLIGEKTHGGKLG